MTTQEIIRDWFETSEGKANSQCIHLTYEEIGKLLGISTSSVSINLPVVVAELYRHQNVTIKSFLDKRREVARKKNLRGVGLPKSIQKELKKLRKRNATYVECAATLKIHYQTVRKYCKLLKC